MKHGKNPTRAQKKLIKKKGLNSMNWLMVKALPDKLIIVQRITGSVKEIAQEGR